MPNEINAGEVLEGLDGHEIVTATGRPSTKVPAAGEVNAWWVDEQRPRFWLEITASSRTRERVGA